MAPQRDGCSSTSLDPRATTASKAPRVRVLTRFNSTFSSPRRGLQLPKLSPPEHHPGGKLSHLLKVRKQSGNLMKRRCSPFFPMPYLMRARSAAADVSANTTGAPAVAAASTRSCHEIQRESAQGRRRRDWRVGLVPVLAIARVGGISTPTSPDQSNAPLSIRSRTIWERSL